MTALEQALDLYSKALNDHRIAGHGERTRTRKALEAAALNVLKEENLARRIKILQAA